MSRGNELVAVVSLLGDENAEVATAALREVRARGLGPSALRDLSESIGDSSLRVRVRDRVEAIRLASLEERLRALVAESSRRTNGRRSRGEIDLETGTLILAAVDRGELDEPRYRRRLDELAAAAEPIVRKGRTSRERLLALARHLHLEEGFSGDEEDYYDVRNSYLPDVLERKVGIPITLSVVYLLVGRRLEMRFRGVGMPYHFILRYESPGFGTFVDPFHGGRLLTVADCREFLKSRGQAFRLEFLRPTPPRAILARMHRNLIQIHLTRNATRKAGVLSRFLAILEGKTPAPRHPIPWELGAEPVDDEDDPSEG